MTLPDHLRVALDLARGLRDLGIPHAVGGSVASSLHGVPRSTADVDFVAALRPADAEALAGRLSASFEVDPDQVRTQLRAARSFNVIHSDVFMKADIFPVRDAFGRAELEDRVQIEVAPGRVLDVVRAEDVLVHKLLWYRMTDETSDRQWRDVLGIVAVQRGHLDEIRILRWARELGVEDLARRALTERGGGL